MTQAVEKTQAGVTATNDQFTYDAEDRRIGKSVNGTQSWYSLLGNRGGVLHHRQDHVESEVDARDRPEWLAHVRPEGYRPLVFSLRGLGVT
jgi:hypothetical protein